MLAEGARPVDLLQYPPVGFGDVIRNQKTAEKYYSMGHEALKSK